MSDLRALFEAISQDQLERVRAILVQTPARASEADEAGCTALMLAARLDRPGLARLLLEAGAELEARDLVHHSTAVAWAAYYGSVAVAAALVDAGADLDSVNGYGLTPAQIAEGGARGEHVADAPERSSRDFVVIGQILTARGTAS